MILLIWLICGIITFVWTFISTYNKDAPKHWSDNPEFHEIGLFVKDNNKLGFTHHFIFLIICLLFGPIIWVMELIDKLNEK